MGDHQLPNKIRMYSRWVVAMDMVAGDYFSITQQRLMYTCLHCTVHVFLPFTFFLSIKIGALSRLSLLPSFSCVKTFRFKFSSSGIERQVGYRSS